MTDRLRAVPDAFDRERVAEIDRRLALVRDEEDVGICLAIESGSRAWGFPSPDSDYDIRFLFVRPLRHYISPWRRRDVIEMPIVDDMDVSGWELGKALALMAKGNAVILEWLTSPVCYDGDGGFREALRALASDTACQVGLARHYYHLGSRQRRTYCDQGGRVPLKQLFYAARPAIALRWLRLNPTLTVPPMHLPTLMAEADLPRPLHDSLADLIVRKAAMREQGDVSVPSALSVFIEGEFADAAPMMAGRPQPLNPALQERISAFYLDSVTRRSPQEASTPMSLP